MPPDTFKRTLKKALELTALVSYFKSGGLYFQGLNRMFTGCFGILPRFSPLLDRTLRTLQGDVTALLSDWTT